MSVNEAQSIAISHGEGPMLVLAGPGSGKTLVITQRIKNLIEHHNVKPENILVITFTKAAALEMQSRFCKMSEGNIYPVNFGTFHAIFFHILKQTYRFDASSIIRESDKYRYLEEIIRNISNDENNNISDDKDRIHMILSEIGKIKNTGINPDEYESEVCDEQEFRHIYKEYKKMLMQCKKVDFDDMVLLCLRLLKERPKVLKQWQDKYKYILIDEFQDINPLQYEVVKMLAKPEDNLFIVGDDDQAIYGFRGSRPEIMLNFEKDYPDAKRILLNVNYRSKKDIVDTSVRLINHNKTRFAKEVMTNNPAIDGVKKYSFETKQQESQGITELIKQYMQRPESKYSDIAIIYRTNSNAALLTDLFIKENIPFQMKEKSQKIYDSSVAKDVIAYLKYAMNESDSESFFRIMNRPVRYISRDSVPVNGLSRQALIYNNKGKEYVIHNVIEMYEKLSFLRKMNPYAAINFVRKGIGYDDYLKKKAKENGTSTDKEMECLEEIQERAKSFESIKEWLEYIDDYDEKIEEAQKREDDAVKIVTMHASKGLEWPVVIIPDINEGSIPHKKAETEEEIEEERRMFFVAMTRAKERLFLFYISSSEKNKAGNNILPSRFIKEITN